MELSDKVLAQGTVKLAPLPTGTEHGFTAPKPDTFTTEPISQIQVKNGEHVLSILQGQL